MIFVTVGTELPFDRLVREVDAWAGRTGHANVFAQIGSTTLQPEHVEFSKFLAPAEFSSRFAAARLIIGHAGMGTILSALRSGKPVLVMPRKASLREHRNDHQLATARRLAEMGKITVAFDEAELRQMLERLDAVEPRGLIGPYASPELISALKDFIHHDGD